MSEFEWLFFFFLTQQEAERQRRGNQPSAQDAKMSNSSAVATNTQVKGALGLTYLMSVYLHTYSLLGVRGCRAAEWSPAGGSLEGRSHGGMGLWSRQTIGWPHPAEHAAPYRGDAGERCLQNPDNTVGPEKVTCDPAGIYSVPSWGPVFSDAVPAPH